MIFLGRSVLTGTGTLSLDRGDLPAGVYDTFLSAAGGEIEFSGSTDYDILSEAPQVKDLKISGTGERRLPNIDLDILGSLTIDGAELVNEFNTTISLYNDIDFDSGDITSNNGTFSFKGSSAQNMNGTANYTGTNAIYNLILDNANGLTLNSDVDIANDLTLTNGKINTSGNTLTITNTAGDAVNGAGSSSYINGPLSKAVSIGGSFTFPVGNNAHYKRIGVTNTSVATTWTAEYKGSHTDTTIKSGDELEQVSENDRWSLGCPASATGKVTLYWDAHSNIDTGGVLSDLRVAKLDETPDPDEWFSVGNTSITGNYVSGSITSDPGVSFSTHDFTLGSLDPEIIPVKLIFFRADKYNQNVRLFWATATEQNAAFFTVEKSRDGQQFTDLEKVPAAGFSNVRIDYEMDDPNPFDRVNYYRLKQTDFDGSIEYFNTIMVEYELDKPKQFSMNAYPNPVKTNESLHLTGKGLNSKDEVLIVLLDMLGKQHYSKIILADTKGEIFEAIDVQKNLKPGVYLVVGSSENVMYNKKIIIKE